MKRQQLEQDSARADRGQRPNIGDRIMVRGIECRIFKVHAFGTVDVETVDGSRAWRVSGLAFL